MFVRFPEEPSERSDAGHTLEMNGDRVGQASPESKALPAERATEDPAPWILLAEDDQEMRDVITLHLRKGGYRVCECRDGVELLNRLSSYLQPQEVGETDRERYDLVITDVRMPGVFGTTVLQGAQDCTGIPPIILITAFGDEELHRRAEELGAASVLDKPFSIRDLLESVRRILRGTGTGRPNG